MTQALKQQAIEQAVISCTQTPFGIKYMIESPLLTPSHRIPVVRSVWIIDHDKAIPRFVTAYPL